MRAIAAVAILALTGCAATYPVATADTLTVSKAGTTVTVSNLAIHRAKGPEYAGKIVEGIVGGLK